MGWRRGDLAQLVFEIRRHIDARHLGVQAICFAQDVLPIDALSGFGHRQPPLKLATLRIAGRELGQLLKLWRLWIPVTHRFAEPPCCGAGGAADTLVIADRKARRPLSRRDRTVPNGISSDWAASRQVRPS